MLLGEWFVATVGLLGGTFDPIHYGHLIIAEAARDLLKLDWIELIPTNDPPHKVSDDVTPAVHRLAMAQTAIAGVDHFVVNEIEVERPGKSYTVDTLDQLTSVRPDDEFVFIVGSDSLYDLPNWKSPDRILELARLAVINRHGDVVRARELEQRLPWLIGRYQILDVPLIDISSTGLRAFVASGRSIRFQTPEAVIAYIRDARLYRATGAR